VDHQSVALCRIGRGDDLEIRNVLDLACIRRREADIGDDGVVGTARIDCSK
jgi:hypothetical protein